MTLEDRIRAADTSITLWKSPQGYQANVMQGGISTWRCEIDADPVVALKRALGEPGPKHQGSIFD